MAASTGDPAATNKSIVRWRYMLGLCCCALVTIIWVSASFIVQGLFDEGWEQPIVISYCSTSVFAMYLPIFYLLKYIRSESNKKNKDGAQYQTLQEDTTADGSILLQSPHDEVTVDLPTAKTIYLTPPVRSFREHFKMSLYFAPLWFIMNMAFNWALTATTVTSTTVLSSTSGLFVVLFSVVLLNKPFLPLHAIGALLTLLGAALISFFNRPVDDDGKHSLRGDMVAVLSALLYALYSVSLEKWSGDSTPRAVTIDIDVAHMPSDSTVPIPLMGAHTQEPYNASIQHNEEHNELSLSPPIASSIPMSYDDRAPLYSLPGLHQGLGSLNMDSQDLMYVQSTHSTPDAVSQEPPASSGHPLIPEISLPGVNPPELEPVLDMILLFGCMGVVNMVLLWPIMLFVHYTGIEPITLPPSHLVPMLLLNAFIGTGLSDFLWANSVILTSPLVSTLSLSATIPLAMLADVIFKDRSFGVSFIFGSALVFAGFILANLGGELSHKKEEGPIEGE